MMDETGDAPRVLFSDLEDARARISKTAKETGYIAVEDRTDRKAVSVDRLEWTADDLGIDSLDDDDEAAAAAVAWLEGVAEMRTLARGGPRRFRARIMAPGGGRQLQSVTWGADVTGEAGGDGEEPSPGGLSLSLSDTPSPLGQQELMRAWTERFEALSATQTEGFKRLFTMAERLQIQAHTWYTFDRDTHRDNMRELLHENKEARAALGAQIRELLDQNGELSATIVNLHTDRLVEEAERLKAKEAQMQTETHADAGGRIVSDGLDLVKQWFEAQAGLSPEAREALQNPTVQTVIAHPRFASFLKGLNPNNIDQFLAHMGDPE